MPKPQTTSDGTWIHVLTHRPTNPGYRPQYSGKWVIPGTHAGLHYLATKSINAGIIEQAKILRNNRLHTVACFYIDVDHNHLHRQFIHYIDALGNDLTDIYYKLDSETRAGVKDRPTNPVISPNDFR